ncbi:hypothetical protein G6011_09265 [Alternaria panax]|uniref:Ubiquitin-like protease family profile domain-containing protein n=1 Tax=Alternaria panax TaxID=48097 RepID=A0AAD4IAZ4_9PLEO|nr:hypothetical protein G6011_09265 [Alternaria panax]
MVAGDKVSNERMPVQGTAQVAPTPSDPSTPHPDSSSQPQSTSYTISQPANAETLSSTIVPVSASGPDSDPSLGSSAVDVDPPKGPELHIEMKGLVSPPTQSDPTMDPQLLGHVRDPSRIQGENQVDDTTPITPSSTDDVGNKMRTKPPVTPLLVDQAATVASSPDDTAGPPTPSTTTPSFGCTTSTLEIFESRRNQAILEHYKRTKIFHKTRSSMVHQTKKMLVSASRGFERGALPTRRTRPPLLKRRYSIEVNTTKDWEIQKYACWSHWNVKQDPLWPRSLETEPPYVTLQQHSIPDPRRYTGFSRLFNTEIPYNTEILLEVGDVTIQNDAFNYIGATVYVESGGEVWMRGESLDMALEVLRRDEDCDTYDIDIANSTVAQICCFAASGIDGPSGEYDQYRARYNDKKWIIVICNDGMGGIENDGTSGTHWSMVAMDRVSKRAYYYDSLWAHLQNYRNLGRNISLSMLNILGEDIPLWKYEVQDESPNQNYHNLFKHDEGACGPFVYKMTQILIKYIKAQQSLGFDLFSMEIDRQWAYQVFRPQFHSGFVRSEMQDSILRWRHTIQASAYADQNDYEAIKDTDTVLDDGPVVVFEVPWKPRLPVLPQTHHTGRPSRPHHTKRGCSSGSNYHDPIELDDSDDNLTIHDNGSGNNATSSSGGVTVVNRQGFISEDAVVSWEDSDDDDLYPDYPDLDGGISLIDENDGNQDEYAPARYERILSHSPEPDDVEQGPSINRHG